MIIADIKSMLQEIKIYEIKADFENQYQFHSALFPQNKK